MPNPVWLLSETHAKVVKQTENIVNNFSSGNSFFTLGMALILVEHVKRAQGLHSEEAVYSHEDVDAVIQELAPAEWTFVDNFAEETPQS